MKKLLIISLLLVSALSFSQENRSENVDETVHANFKKLEKQYKLNKVNSWSRRYYSSENLIIIKIGYTDIKTNVNMFLVLTGYYDSKLNKDVIIKKTTKKQPIMIKEKLDDGRIVSKFVEVE
jgi:hypothetical protein